MTKLRVWSVILLFVSFSNIFAGTSGKLVGKVSIGETGEPLIGANVMIEGTNIGAASDVDGKFIIMNIPPGIYSVKCSMIGYKLTTFEDVQISMDLTTSVEYALEQSALEMDEVVVLSHRDPMVVKDLTASTSVVTAEDIALLPVNDVSELLGMQAGMIAGHVRGGRSGEIMYAIDGVPMTDVFDGSSVVDVNKNMVSELQFVSGAFNAEYGRAMSGYVNIVTKSGDNNIRGGFDLYNGSNYSTNTNVFRGIDNYAPLGTYNLEGYLNYPLLKDRVFFYGNYRKYHRDGWMNAKHVFNPWDITINKGASFAPDERYIFQATGDSSIVPMNWEDHSYFHGKLMFKLSQNINLNYNAIVDSRDWQDYNHSFAYNPYGDIVRHLRANTNSLTLTHMLSTQTFYDLIVSGYTRDYSHYVYEDPSDTNYTHYLLFQQAPTETPSFLTGGTNSEHFYRTTKNILGKLDLTSQINEYNQVKTGIEFVGYKLDYRYFNLIQAAGIPNPDQTMNPYVDVYIPDPANPEENTAINIYTREPIEASTYIQDKIELKNLIINVGLRYDYFDAKGLILNDPTDPDIYRPKKPQNVAEPMDERLSHWYKESKPKSSLSPRFGFAFPITAGGVVHFSYGLFFQAPNFELLYSNPEFKFSEGTGNLGVAGNSDLDPEKTISGEIGLKQAISEDMAVEVTAYFRDIRNLAGTRADEITIFGGTSWYNQYQNSDFGFVKGFIFALDKRLSDSWSSSIDYTYQIAKGNASDPNSIRNQILSGELPEIQLIYLNFDQTHTINFNFAYNSNGNWGVGLVGQYGSGLPYTPDQSINISKLLTNSETKPDYFNVNMNAYKTIRYAGMGFKFSLRVHNLLDRLNENGVYNDSGTANYTWQEYNYTQSGATAIVNSLEEYYRHPGFYSEPRRIELGVAIDWNRK